jgi:hypothetical protein
MWALGAMAAFAMCNFLLSAVDQEATDKKEAGISAIFLVWAVAGICGIVACAVFGPMSIIEGIKGRKNIFLILATGAVNAGAMLFLTLALAEDPGSAGPITAMLPLNSVLVSALAGFR